MMDKKVKCVFISGIILFAMIFVWGIKDILNVKEKHNDSAAVSINESNTNKKDSFLEDSEIESAIKLSPAEQLKAKEQLAVTGHSYYYPKKQVKFVDPYDVEMLEPVEEDIEFEERQRLLEEEEEEYY
ncbi:MAG: hypothetical protein DRP78_06600 [Candidatus Omnitrophota bacterium]|nr:MAG: hypothetical protein DRP78_06600 [Candidatus Omnitrophota bacterium]